MFLDASSTQARDHPVDCRLIGCVELQNACFLLVGRFYLLSYCSEVAVAWWVDLPLLNTVCVGSIANMINLSCEKKSRSLLISQHIVLGEGSAKEITGLQVT